MAAVDEITVIIDNDNMGDGGNLRGAPREGEFFEGGQHDGGKGGIVFGEVGEGLLRGIV